MAAINGYDEKNNIHIFHVTFYGFLVLHEIRIEYYGTYSINQHQDE
jgi:hypothetical protein